MYGLAPEPLTGGESGTADEEYQKAYDEDFHDRSARFIAC